jgi:hypothetical protein
MTKGANPPLLNKHFFHHLNQLAIVQNLFDDMGMGLAIILAVRKTTLSTHLFTPLMEIIRSLHSFSKKMKSLISIPRPFPKWISTQTTPTNTSMKIKWES